MKRYPLIRPSLNHQRGTYRVLPSEAERAVSTRSQGLALYRAKMRLITPNAANILVFSALTGLVFGVFRLLFNFYVLSLGGYDEQFLGLLTSVSSAASLAMAIPAAYLAERFSQKRVMVVSSLIGVVTFLGLVLWPTRGSLIFFNILSGLVMTTRQVAVAPFLMNNTSEEERQYVFSFQFGLNTIASFVGNLVGGLLPTWLGALAGTAPTATLSYRLALASMMLVSLLSIGPLLLIRDTASDGKRRIEMPWTLMWQHRTRLTKLILPQWIIGLGAGMMMPFMNLYYRNVFGQSDAVIGYLFASGALAMAIAQFIAPPMAERMGKVNTVVFTQALSVPFLISLGVAAWAVPHGGNPTLWFAIAWLAYLVRLALMNLSGPVYQTFILEQVPPNVQALATSLNNIAFQFGWVLSPQVSGWMQMRYGFVPVFLSTSVLYIIGITITWVFFRGQEQRGRLPHHLPSRETVGK